MHEIRASLRLWYECTVRITIQDLDYRLHQLMLLRAIALRSKVSPLFGENWHAKPEGYINLGTEGRVVPASVPGTNSAAKAHGGNGTRT